MMDILKKEQHKLFKFGTNARMITFTGQGKDLFKNFASKIILI